MKKNMLFSRQVSVRFLIAFLFTYMVGISKCGYLRIWRYTILNCKDLKIMEYLRKNHKRVINVTIKISILKNPIY